jgi:hypothetical protein
MLTASHIMYIYDDVYHIYWEPSIHMTADRLPIPNRIKIPTDMATRKVVTCKPNNARYLF